MTATAQPESKPSSRRALLAGALGGIGALAASAIGRASPVRAGVDGDVVLGAGNPATNTTSITNSSNSNVVFQATSIGSGTGVQGSTGGGIGVLGSSGTGNGVYGASTSHIGVYGSSSAGYAGVFGEGVVSPGVYGTSDSASQPASLGQSYGNSTGVLGFSGGGFSVLPAAKAKTGVFGYAAQDAASVGVRGESPAGFGIYGKTTGTGFAGYFNGKVYMTQFLEMGEISTPTSPGANKARLFIKDNGLGKTQLVVKFANGTVKVLATEG